MHKHNRLWLGGGFEDVSGVCRSGCEALKGHGIRLDDEDGGGTGLGVRAVRGRHRLDYGDSVKSR